MGFFANLIGLEEEEDDEELEEEAVEEVKERKPLFGSREEAKAPDGQKDVQCLIGL